MGCRAAATVLEPAEGGLNGLVKLGISRRLHASPVGISVRVLQHSQYCHRPCTACVWSGYYICHYLPWVDRGR